MKKLIHLLIIALLICKISWSQAPESFNYQAVIRDNSGELIINQAIGIRVAITNDIYGGTIFYRESHSVSTNNLGIVDLKIGEGTSDIGNFSNIDWGASPAYLQIEIDVTGGTSYDDLGTFQLHSVPYALYSNSANNLGDAIVYSTATDTLFVVKDHSGNVVFAVFPDGAQIIVNEAAKGKVGGFAISGRSPSKTVTNSYLQVYPDSTRIFVKDSVAGFGVANIEGGSSESFLNLNKQNYLIGHQTGSNTTGAYNSMIGYQAGYTNSSGSNNIFFGYKAGYLNQTGGNNVFIGTESGYVNQFTYQNTYVGHRSGYNLSGAFNTLLGSMAGEEASGGNNTFIGTSAGRKAKGGNNTFVGESAGYSASTNTGVRNTYIGQKAGAFTTTGEHNVMLGFDAGYLNYEGSNNTFLGYDSGHNIHAGSGNIFIGHEAGKNINGISDRLIIENSSADSTSAMIYGDFNKNQLRINSVVGINTNASTGYGLVVNGGSSGSYSIYAYKGGYTLGSWYGASDIRLKKDINNIKNSLNIIKSINGVVFNWKVEEFPEMQLSSRHQIGVIAQDIEKVLPELVSEDEQGFKAVAYDKLSAVFIEAIKEQQTQIENLKSENEALKQKLNEIIEMLETR